VTPQTARRKHRQGGMTLLEVLIATMLLAMVAVVVFSAFAIGLRAAALASGMNAATSLAEEMLAVLAASPCGSSFRTVFAETPEDARLAGYRREATARQTSTPGLWELSATVRWRQAGQARSVTLVTTRYVSTACGFVGQ
jgi:prepilin-type N-terminal cleavage/methylation domain-containing protein